MTHLPGLLKLQCCFCSHLMLEPNNHIFALMSVSLRDLPLLYDIFGGYKSSVFSKGCFFFYNTPLLHQYLLTTFNCCVLHTVVTNCRMLS